MPRWWTDDNVSLELSSSSVVESSDVTTGFVLLSQLLKPFICKLRGVTAELLLKVLSSACEIPFDLRHLARRFWNQVFTFVKKELDWERRSGHGRLPGRLPVDRSVSTAWPNAFDLRAIDICDWKIAFQGSVFAAVWIALGRLFAWTRNRVGCSFHTDVDKTAISVERLQLRIINVGFSVVNHRQRDFLWRMCWHTRQLVPNFMLSK